MLMRNPRAGLLAILPALGLACGPTPPFKAASQGASVRALRGIDGHIADLDFVATREEIINSGMITLVTAAGDTLLLLMPGDIRCGRSSQDPVAGLEAGMAIRVYMKPKQVQVARERHAVVEWAEVDCISSRP